MRNPQLRATLKRGLGVFLHRERERPYLVPLPDASFPTLSLGFACIRSSAYTARHVRGVDIFFLECFVGLLRTFPRTLDLQHQGPV